MSDEKHKPWCSERARKESGGCICEAASSFAAPHGSVAWTKTPPAIPGHYWVRFGSRQSMTVLEVEEWHGKMQCYYYQAWRPLGDAKYWHDVEWWPSPITPPPNGPAHRPEAK